MKEETLTSINQVIDNYFQANTEENTVSANALMPYFIEASLFVKDEKNGLPIRKILRTLDEENALHQIPTLHAERKDKHTFWYFVREGFEFTATDPNDTGLTKIQKAKLLKSQSDEHYLINHCDDLLGVTALRNFKFNFILGNYHKDGKTRSSLPVSAYYPEHNLVIELIVPEDAISIDHPKRQTPEGTKRAELMGIYAERKKRGLQEKGVNFIEIPYASFAIDESGDLVREEDKDLDLLKTYLKGFLTES
ncbi:MAG: hypothetical protein RIA69_18385 [Cyclobacteriaceae bacterium]